MTWNDDRDGIASVCQTYSTRRFRIADALMDVPKGLGPDLTVVVHFAVQVVGVRNGLVRLGIEAPPEVKVLRGELQPQEAGQPPREARDLRQVSDSSALGPMVDEVLTENPGPVEQFRGGKEGALNALVGHVMKKTRGSANPKIVQELLRERLSAP